jgi:MoxR-like ATPase
MFDPRNINAHAEKRPDKYVMPTEELRQAVNMCLWLQKPLLITGAPGTGKTQLAYKVAYELAQLPAEKLEGLAPFIGEPFEFNTKTTSSASDLFYYYDAVKHFQQNAIRASESNKNSDEGKETAKSAHSFIQLNALGKAILQSFGKKNILVDEKLKGLALLDKFEELEDEPRSCVVLIDEIDKAPRDFPNDLLNEIENYEFRINELNKKIVKPKQVKPFPAVVVIMTSNFEKNLPDAFLRRCLFYHIPSVGKEMLYKIVASRMEVYLQNANNNQLKDEDLKTKLTEINKAVDEFTKMKANAFKDKKPSTSELLEWIKVLELKNFFTENTDFAKLTDHQKTILRYTLPIIAKSKEDLENLTANYQ